MYFIFLQPVLSDITSHQRLVDSVIEKAQGVLHTTSNPEVAAFITDINSRYEELCQIAKVSVFSFKFNCVLVCYVSCIFLAVLFMYMQVLSM